MTKLTNYERDAFVSAVMADVPMVDYSEKITAAAQKQAVSMLPKPVQAIWKDPALRGYLNTTTRWAGNVSVSLPCDYEQAKEAIKAAAEFVKLHEAQQEKTEALRKKLRSTAYAFTTRKALADALPEFAHYLPKDDAKTKDLPALANVVSDFVAAGWPTKAKKSSGKL